MGNLTCKGTGHRGIVTLNASLVGHAKTKGWQPDLRKKQEKIIFTEVAPCIKDTFPTPGAS
eukprot:1138912-Pelagomonas_calceolata.AAC.2